MDSITHREMRNNSGAVLKRVAAGETLIITNNGKPAALLSPIAPTNHELLTAQGRLRPGVVPFDVAALPPPVRTLTSVDEMLDDDRGER